MSEAKKKRKTRVVRPPGLAVFAGFCVIVAGVWILLADAVLERGVEQIGASMTGARVDLEYADIRLTEGSVAFAGLQVADPDEPFRNLIEAEEIVADVLVEPLLRKKVVVEQLTVTGVRFGTERTESGALTDPDPEAGELLRRVDEWADQFQVPELSFDNFGGVVETDAIDADSLVSVQYARSLASRADSLRGDWGPRLESLDPRPRIDSLGAVVDRIEAFRPTPLNAVQIPGLVRDGRAALASLNELQSEVAGLDDRITAELPALVPGTDQLAALRAEDLAYARSLLNIPSLDAPTISPVLFGDAATVWVKPFLYWAQTAERFLPPGLDPKNRPGPSRARAEGTTFDFRDGAVYPSFWLQQADLEVGLDGEGASAGIYSAEVSHLTSAPALVGQPMRLAMARDGASVGPGSLSLEASLDHTGPVLNDSFSLAGGEIQLPAIQLGGFGGEVDLGLGEGSISLSRVGDQIDGAIRVATNSPSWSGAPGEPATEAGRNALPGSPEWARNVIWSTLSGLSEIELTVGISGSLTSPDLDISSNVGEAVANTLRAELGAQVDEAEARVTEEVNARIDPVLNDARARADAVRAEFAETVALQRAQIESLRARLEDRLGSLVGLTR